MFLSQRKNFFLCERCPGSEEPGRFVDPDQHGGAGQDTRLRGRRLYRPASRARRGWLLVRGGGGLLGPPGCAANGP